MRIPRIYLPHPIEPGHEVELDDNAFRHAVQVLRLKESSTLILFNGEGGEYQATLRHVTKRSAAAHIDGFTDCSSESPLASQLALGISKGERMDFAIQKAVELGVSEISPLYTEYCVVNFDAKRKQKRLEHWRAIIISACEQCGRNELPLLHEPEKFESWCNRAQAGLKLILDPQQDGRLAVFGKPEGKILVTIGPEGGFSENETRQAKQNGFAGIGLGPRILRTETAALTVLAVLQGLWGDLV